jgi:IS5 family transposase
VKKQLTLASNEFERFRKPTRREKFLVEMNTGVPWAELCALIEPYYPQASSAGGRPPAGLGRMLRIHCLQLWFDLSDPAVEEALYDSRAMRAFVGIDLGCEPVPDESTVMRFRHLLEAHALGVRILEEVGRVLMKRGLRLSKGTIVDATIIAAPSSTKNVEGSRDPEMHQTKKGQQWYFGMKVHVGVDSRSKAIHSLVVTPANTADCKVMGQLLHGAKRRVYGDQSAVQVEVLHRRGDPGEEPHEVAHPLTRGAFDRGHQARIRLHQGALSRAGQERQPGVPDRGPGEHLHAALRLLGAVRPQ